MNRLPLLALAGLACLLVALLGIEYRGGDRPASFQDIRAGAGQASAGVQAAPAPHPVPPEAVSATALEAWAGTVLARPLFSPSRRPGAAAVAASTELPRLAGIIVGPGGARAIFAGSGDGRAIVAAPGSRAGPYLVRAVGLGGVSVLGPNGSELLHPVYDHDAQRPTAMPPPEVGTPSILDLLRSRVQSVDGLKSSVLSPPILHPPTSR